jgi:hypothetical protein
MGKQLVKFITCGCETSAPFFCNLQSRAWTHAVLVIGLYELLGNPTTWIIEAPVPSLHIGNLQRSLKVIYTSLHIIPVLTEFFIWVFHVVVIN